MKITTYSRNTLLSLPLLAITLLVFVWLGRGLQIDLSVKIAMLGALGWWMALILRLPFILLSKKFASQDKARNFIVALSGPCEELTRLVLLIIIGRAVDNAFSVGLGWAAVEIVYSVIQTTALGTLEHKNDAKAQQAKAFLKAQGLDKSLEPSAPFVAAFERVGANAVHISFSLLLVLSPWVVLLTIPLHSSLNFFVLRGVKKSMFWTEIIFVFLGLNLLALSIQLTR